MKKVVVAVLVVILVGAGVWFWLQRPAGQMVAEKPLDKYTFEALRERNYFPSEINFLRIIKTDPKFTSWVFIFTSDGKKVSGLANFPVGVGTTSASFKKTAILLHGFADQKEYSPGFGTQRVAEVLARNGYVTFAPDFLGLGESDPAERDAFEDRFLTYTTTLNLIASVEAKCGGCQMIFWGHSNGGQIALSVLAISGKDYPTVLWNPVSKPFPYNILYYTDTFEDQGKWLRRALADFEKDYDVEKYSTVNFLSWIKAPILLQQGEGDEWVPKRWSDDLRKRLADSGKQIEYKVYPGADHNLSPGWDRAVVDMLRFLAQM